MFNVSKWAILVLSVLSLAVVGCGDDKGNDDGAGGSAGTENTAGTGGGEAGTGGDEEPGEGGTGGNKEPGEGGTGGEDELDCVASCDHVYECGYAWAGGPVEGCYAACEAGELDRDQALCLQNAACEDFEDVCLASCEDKAINECLSEGGDCFDTYGAAELCATENGCLTPFGLDRACYLASCGDEADALTACLDNDCAALAACE